MEVLWRCPDHASAAVTVGVDFLSCSAGCQFPMDRGVVASVTNESYSTAFGLQWDRWRHTQLDSFTGTRASESRLRAALGRDAFSTLAGKRVLEVGCGAGRFTEILLAAGAEVVSVDLSSAIFSNALNCPPSDQHVLVQADVTRMPLQVGQFDVVVALGMVQHTPSPPRTIAALWSMVAPSGLLVFDHYRASLRHVLQIKPLYRQVMKRQDPRKAMSISDKLYDRWAPRHHRLKGRLSRLLLTRVSPIVCLTTEYPDLSNEVAEQWGRLDTYDSLTDWYKHRARRSQVDNWLKRLGISDAVIQPGVNGWVVRASRH